MRLAILADVHGSLTALEAVLGDLHKYRPDHIIVAGDMVAGPHSTAVLCQLRDLGCLMVRGNNEDYVRRFDSGEAPDWWFTSKQFSFIRWVYEHMDRASLDFIQSLPEQCVVEIDRTDAIRVVHGSPRNLEENLYPDYSPESLEIALSQIHEPVLICGHTHIPWARHKNGRLAFNPGAVCGSLHGSTNASYALLNWRSNQWEVEHHAVPFDKALFRKACLESGIMEGGYPFSRIFMLTVETGQNVADDFLPFAYEMAAEAGYADSDYVPDDILNEAVKEFPWEKYIFSASDSGE